MSRRGRRSCCCCTCLAFRRQLWTFGLAFLAVLQTVLALSYTRARILDSRHVVGVLFPLASTVAALSAAAYTFHQVSTGMIGWDYLCAHAQWRFQVFELLAGASILVYNAFAQLVILFDVLTSSELAHALYARKLDSYSLDARMGVVLAAVPDSDLGAVLSLFFMGLGLAAGLVVQVGWRGRRHVVRYEPANGDVGSDEWPHGPTGMDPPRIARRDAVDSTVTTATADSSPRRLGDSDGSIEHTDLSADPLE